MSSEDRDGKESYSAFSSYTDLDLSVFLVGNRRTIVGLLLIILCLNPQVLITIYWLGRKANLDAFYNGPQLNFKAFEGLLGLALSKVSCSQRLFIVCSFFFFLYLSSRVSSLTLSFKIQALDEGSVFVKDGGDRECWYAEREECRLVRRSYKRETSVDSVDSLDSRALRQNSEGACSYSDEAFLANRWCTPHPFQALLMHLCTDF